MNTQQILAACRRAAGLSETPKEIVQPKPEAMTIRELIFDWQANDADESTSTMPDEMPSVKAAEIDADVMALRTLFQAQGVRADELDDKECWGVVDATGPFLTGSRAYGIPVPRSDTDIVILVDEKPAAKAASDPHDPGYGGLSLHFGALNLILETSPAKFAAWKQGTAELCAKAPVTREVAVEHFKALFAKLEDGTDESADDKQADRDTCQWCGMAGDGCVCDLGEQT